MSGCSSFARLGLFAALLLAAGCPESDDGFTTGMGDADTTEEPPEVPDEVYEFLDVEDLMRLDDAGMPLYYGDDPPNIEGTFLLDSLLIVYDDSGWEGLPILTYWITFADQAEDQRLTCSYECPEAGDVGFGTDGYISGQEDCFSVFIDVSGQTGGCEYRSLSAYSGCKRPEGIKGFHHGFMMLEKQGEDCDLLVEVDSIRVVEETDDLAEPTEEPDQG